ncbi:tail fiber domain-containing protein [Pseudomonas songnenensis]|uniref:Tail fiber domain-containing protein n=1 Tax=Pseudomonas songnenensis TaxID=1176259 RepID=A0A482UIM3_9PSED|nr:tail fiber domain-containing protein [Pseudomonas songnenensis]RYJ63260.1 tail fiber domain-containing protein [Pseudomonas songnenensis]
MADDLPGFADMKAKLDGIQSGATSNATDAQLRARSTHTGQQAQSTITGLSTSLAAKADLNNTVLQYNGATKFQTTSAGVSITGTFSATSDRKFKSNEQPHDAAVAWSRLCALQVKTYRYDLIGKDYTGFIAQEVQQVYPNSVDLVESDDGRHLVLTKDEIIADLVAVVQEQQRRLSRLEDLHDAAK